MGTIAIIIVIFIVGWCIGVKAGGDYEYNRLTEFYMNQAEEKGFEIKEYKSFKEKLAKKVAENKS